MIHVLFVPGMFGSTIEHVLRSFTEEYTPTSGVVANDGSMHTFSKEFHPYSREVLESTVTLQPNSITTPTYPFKNSHLPEIIYILEQVSPSADTDRWVLLYAPDIRSAELNMLFQYHKIAFGARVRLGLEIFCDNNLHNVVEWDPIYTSWQDMQQWELREWLSLFYVGWTQEWIESQNQVSTGVLKIPYLDVLNNFAPTLNNIIKHCNLTQKPGLENFGKEWRSKQQYIVDEFELLEQIVSHTANGQDLAWQPIHIVAEAIVQQRLRALGYEIRCDGLNSFPTDSKTLYNLLEKV